MPFRARHNMFQSMRRVVFVALGLLFVGIGVVGVFLPVLPTTVFLMVATYFFTRSSPALNERVRRIRLLQPYLRHIEGSGPIPIKSKLRLLALMWITITISIIVLTVRGGFEPWLVTAIVITALVGSLVIVKYRSSPKEAEPTVRQ